MALDDWEQGHYKHSNSSVVCEDPNAISLQVQFLSFVQELFELSSEIEPFPKTKPIPLSRYPLARKGILFGGPAMEKSFDTRRR